MAPESTLRLPESTLRLPERTHVGLTGRPIIGVIENPKHDTLPEALNS